MMTPTPDGRRQHGALREEVLRLLLHAPTPMTARQVTAALAERDGTTPALTTILTVLDRLHRAGEVRKDRGDGDLRFSVAQHEASTVADDMLEALMRSKDRTGALLSFAGALDPEDLEALQALLGRAAKGADEGKGRPSR